jgi:diaminohydroxyphosphoribosylaminopyrimidine deaminase/5-amino-6-(5-phosphoribosylamino)uracil reductase
LFSATQEAPAWVVTTAVSDPERKSRLREQGVDLIDVQADHAGNLDLAAVLAALGVRGITRLLVEGGGGLAAALMAQRLVDRLAWFHAPLVLGGDGVPAVAAFGLGPLADAPVFERLSSETIGADTLTIFRVRQP